MQRTLQHFFSSCKVFLVFFESAHLLGQLQGSLAFTAGSSAVFKLSEQLLAVGEVAPGLPGVGSLVIIAPFHEVLNFPSRNAPV